MTTVSDPLAPVREDLKQQDIRLSQIAIEAAAKAEAEQKALEKELRRKWATPPNRFAPWHKEFAFTLDLAADATNHKLLRWCGPDSPMGWFDGLDPSLPLAGERIFNNPPGFDWAWTRHIWWLMGLPPGRRPRLAVQLRPANQTDSDEWAALIEPWRSGGDHENDVIEQDLFFHVRFLHGRVKHIPPPGIKASSPTSGHLLLIWRDMHWYGHDGSGT